MKALIAVLLCIVSLSPASADTYVVTTLADSGPGSLREALAKSGRTVTFRIAGVIRLRSMLEFTGRDLTIDGASAPGTGITVRDKTFSLNGAKDVTIRHLRFRHANNDAFRIVGDCRQILLENCSFTHGGDGALDITHDYKSLKRPGDVVVRRCLIAATDKAMLVVGADRLILERNLFTNTGQRNPQLHDAKEFNLLNNVIRNFTVYGLRVRAASSGNAVGNVIPLSPLLPKRPDRTFLIDPTSGECSVYTSGNIGPSQHDPNKFGTQRSPVGLLPNTTDAAGLEAILETEVGARPLDAIDSALVANDPRIKFRPSMTKDK
ncbi:MAG: right-handed parallel beta-helix repeat-containing protein [Verrucomicrobiae bacterium]|nr:right-handed parallel beta-helix repeat-containing protein [Verrucomicrobiae bacterium]